MTLITADQRMVNYDLLRTLTASEWNEAVQAARAEDPDFSLDMTRLNLEAMGLSGRDFEGARFDSSCLASTSFRHCNLTNTRFDSASVRNADFSFADLTGSNAPDEAIWWDSAVKYEVVGWKPPLPDVTKQVAQHYLNEAINDPASIVNEGLAEIIDSGVRAWWSGNKLKFYMTAEIEKHRDLCYSNECDCEIDHVCTSGDCTCCPCYDDRCSCEKDHSGEEIEGTDDYYLGTVVGNVTYQWSDAVGYYCVVNAEHGTCHPHVSEDLTICWGDAPNPDTLRVADYLMKVQGWLHQHNPASEYRDIEELPFLR